MIQISFVIPTYNERENIKILIPKIESLFLEKYKFEIIIVDDSSPDKTAELSEKLNKKYHNIRTVIRKKKEGIGAALRAGYNEAKGEVILSSDADLSFKVEDMLRLMDKINEGYDLVVGSRHKEEGMYENRKLLTKLKYFVSKSGNKFIRFFLGLKIHDFSANFRAIKRDVWNDIETKDNTNSLLLEMILKTKLKNYKIAEVPVEFKERKYGVSKLRLSKEIPKFFLKIIYFFFLFNFKKLFSRK